MIENLGQSYYLSLPNKLFEYFAAGLPVIGSDFPEIGQVLRTSGAGIAVDPAEAGALAAAINLVLGDADMVMRMKQQATTAAATYTWGGEEGRFSALLRSTLDAVER
jgi:glycosyltransferase involved in cell wall biosynthesis